MKIFGALFGMAFGLLFASAGIFIALETVIPSYQSWQAMQGWRPSSAVLLTVAGSENSTEASYRYQVAGIEYRNDRVYIAAFKDNIGSYHQELYQSLRQRKDNAQPVTIWFDSANPADSVIDREMRWGLFALMCGFCSVFIFAGLAVCYASLRVGRNSENQSSKLSLSALRKEWQQKQQQTQNGEDFFEFVRQKRSEPADRPSLQTKSMTGSAPWLNKKEWRENRIRSGAKTGLYFIWGFAIVWNGISAPILFVLEDEINRHNYAALLGLLFPLVGLFLLFKAWRMTREWRYFGVIELQMDPFPGSIGGHVGGSLSIAKPACFGAAYKVELECVHSYASGSGDNRSQHENIKWSEQGFANVEYTGRGVRLEFRFDVPENLPEADMVQSGNYHFWRMRLSGECDGIELKREYNIPVFKTQTLSRSIRHDISAQAAELRKEQSMISSVAISRGDFERTPLARAFRYEDTGQEQQFYYPMFRNKWLTLFALIFAGGFDFAAYSINQGFDVGGVMAIGMLVFSLPFALVGLLATIAVIYLPFNNLKVTLTHQKLSALRRLLFIPIAYHVMHNRDIRNILIKSTGSTGSGARQIKHYSLVVQDKAGRQFTIAEDIDGQDLAEQLKQFIAKRLGVTISK